MNKQEKLNRIEKKIQMIVKEMENGSNINMYTLLTLYMKKRDQLKKELENI